MQLTGYEIIERGIITNYDEKKAIQQQGVDVRIDKVKALAPPTIVGQVPSGKIFKEKSEIPRTAEINTKIIDGRECYALPAGYYEIDLMEGIHMTPVTALYFKTRSSLVRSGAIVHSGQFDAGFTTDQAGCYLDVRWPIIIEKGARIAQAIVHTSNPVKNLYDGQFQGDKQRF